MSKLSFRARALDASKPMPVFHTEDLPDLPEYTAINRAVPQMPTGMEKEEESERHLQRAMSAQQVYGAVENLVIPTPPAQVGVGYYEDLYEGQFKPQKQFVHVQALNMEQDYPEYDMDSDDERWMNSHNKRSSAMTLEPQQFEEMMDRLEKGSGQQPVTLQEAKLLLKEDDDLIKAVYDYWLKKRNKSPHPLIAQVRTEKRDGSTTNNPYVAFRRRTEKMQTRKNRKNDEASYEKMLKLRRDLNRAVTLLEMVKRREKSKRELLHLTIEIVEKRYQSDDFSGQLLAEVMAQRHQRPSYTPSPVPNGSLYAAMQGNRPDWANRINGQVQVVRKKREYKKRKHKTAAAAHVKEEQGRAHPTTPTYSDMDLHKYDFPSSEEDVSPAQSAEEDTDNDPDGSFAFRRKKGCNYYQARVDTPGNWPWEAKEEGGLGDPRYRYSCTTLSMPRRCVGFVRRRVGRGGRVILDRVFTPFDDALEDLDLSNSSSLPNGLPPSWLTDIRNKKWRHFRPRSPPSEDDSSPSQAPPSFSDHLSSLITFPASPPEEISAEQFHDHQQELVKVNLGMQKQQLAAQQDEAVSTNLNQSFSSQPTSRFTVDSASAQFAVSAVVSNTENLDTSLKLREGTESAHNGVLEATGSGTNKAHSTSPPAAVLQLNYPLSQTPPVPVNPPPPATTLVTSTTRTGSPQAPPTPSAAGAVTPNPSSSLARMVAPSNAAVLKLAAPTSNSMANNVDSISRENHEDGLVNSIGETTLAMEVT
ncbi:PREDICTED: enhancer of polycomb homolog 1-like isoform X2 [Branchiostoma belcheri]|uniref:Enhancer of polycomb-like protein n=1 Tax=Branchiostoma belcheri TaxID=7741 RepID=A0A6P4YKQ5_BRABE|nr:PREDICTED: enhancer of polycomb homolog 1-like isoform X2 [Branchiostoma belcheri]